MNIMYKKRDERELLKQMYNTVAETGDSCEFRVSMDEANTIASKLLGLGGDLYIDANGWEQDWYCCIVTIKDEYYHFRGTGAYSLVELNRLIYTPTDKELVINLNDIINNI